MSKNATRLVTQARIKQLIECYGSSSSTWPEEERLAAENLLKGSPDLITLREQSRPLDNVILEYQAQEGNSIDPRSVQTLQQRIMDQLPGQELPENNSAVPHMPTPRRFGLWAGSIAASVLVASLTLGVINQMKTPDSNLLLHSSSDITGNAFARWVWEDITGESIETKTENDPATLYALIALEFPAE